MTQTDVTELLEIPFELGRIAEVSEVSSNLSNLLTFHERGIVSGRKPSRLLSISLWTISPFITAGFTVTSDDGQVHGISDLVDTPLDVMRRFEQVKTSIQLLNKAERETRKAELLHGIGWLETHPEVVKQEAWVRRLVEIKHFMLTEAMARVKA